MSQIMQLRDARSVTKMSQVSSGIRASKQFGKSVKTVCHASKGFNGTFLQVTQQRSGWNPAVMPKAKVARELYTVAAAGKSSDIETAVHDAVDASGLPKLMSDGAATLENVSESTSATLGDLKSKVSTSADSVAASVSSKADDVAAGVDDLTDGLKSGLSNTADSVAAGVSKLAGKVDDATQSAVQQVEK